MQNHLLICLSIANLFIFASCRTVSNSDRLQSSGLSVQIGCLAKLANDRYGTSLFLRDNKSYLQVTGGIQATHNLNQFTYSERGKDFVADFQNRTCTNPIEAWGQEGFSKSGNLILYFHGITEQFHEMLRIYAQVPHSQIPLAALVSNDQVLPTCLLQRATQNIEILRTDTGTDARIVFKNVFFPSELHPTRSSIGLRVPVGTGVGEGIVAAGPGAMITVCKNLLQISAGKEEIYLPIIQN